ncbi:HD-GYP domain-containing protein [Alteromonas sp. ASW11-130]|uniref:HD-GYP domain-containing protein n=1 Tax=Alteromonas sp. ASW11-130 TaxID=3015775 RepID=UPI0022427179|nr:HD-GYP domain-containing protein [Alteromonas sp. ASW11-130]MCW8092810.1 HD-GYP domain-containing protein [Alteromonas sp. ASW11-130]
MQVNIDDLKPGMYVTQVVKQSGAMAIRSRGLVKSEAIIDQLRTKGIEVVEIDVRKSKIETAVTVLPEEEKSESPKAKSISSASITTANDLYGQALTIHSQLIKALQSGAPKDFTPVSELSTSIINSVFENQNALLCLTMIKDADEYLLEHSINCSILMAMFASHLGMSQEEIDHACMGAMLMDIGMAQIPEELRTSKGELTEEQWEVIRSHVKLGKDLVEQFEGIPESVLTIIEQHHERNDGSGYPKGLKDDEISQLARMAAIIDSYDAMISDRPFQEAVSPAVALKRLNQQDNLDKDLIKKFIQCVGVHPVGSLVKLKSGKLGIVAQLGKKDLMKPVVMTFYNINSGHYSEIKRMDLSQVHDEIVSGVTPGDVNLNLPKFFHEVFVGQIPER